MVDPYAQVFDLVREALQSLKDDAPQLDLIHDYFEGDQADPYAPRDTTAQIKDTQRRSITNLMPLLIGLPTEVCHIEGYRRGTFGEGVDEDSEELRFPREWEDWQRNRMDSKQSLIYETAFKYGRAIPVLEQTPKGPRIDVLPARRTVPFMRDSANDIRPEALVTIRRYPDGEEPGRASVWDQTHAYEVLFKDGDKLWLESPGELHGADGCPAVRYHCFLDDDGAVEGMVARAIVPQDRLNQAVFGTNVIADNSSFKVRTAAGLVPTYRTTPEGELILDPNGDPMPEPVEVSQARMLISTNKDTKFGTLDETPLDGFLDNEDRAARNFLVTNQLPPYVVLGSVSNVSAEALDATEVQFRRFIEWAQRQFADSHEELFRIICEMKGDAAGASSYGGEVRWKSMSIRSFAAWMDGLAKGVESVQIPIEAAWGMVPGVSSQERSVWRKMREKQLKEDLTSPYADQEAISLRESAPLVTEPVESDARLGSAYGN